MLEIGFEYVNKLLFFIVNFQINGNNKYNYTATECGLFMLKPVHLYKLIEYVCQVRLFKLFSPIGEIKPILKDKDR